MSETNPINRRVTRHIVALPALVGLAFMLLAPPAFAHHGERGGAALAAAQAAQAAQAQAPAPAPGATAPTPAPTQLTAPTPTPTPTPAAPTISTLDVGATGDAVKAVEQKLDSLKYFVGPVDGTFDQDTKQGVLAFQKVHNLDRTGIVTQTLWTSMQTATNPAPMVAGGAGHRVEIDLNRQVLFLYEGGALSKIIAVSSGTSDTPTPTGDFRIYSKSVGWETSPLGQLYNSQYFVGGYAIHGSKSVPAEPASHGCVRLPMTAADWFPDHVAIGTPVHIR